MSHKRQQRRTTLTPWKGHAVRRRVTTSSSAEDLLRAVAAEIGLGHAVEILAGERARVKAVSRGECLLGEQEALARSGWEERGSGVRKVPTEVYERNQPAAYRAYIFGQGGQKRACMAHLLASTAPILIPAARAAVRG
jgi:hypothetical protein